MAPTGTVTIELTSDDTSAVTVTPTISFDATDWNTAKTVTVTGEEDEDTVGESVSISYAISGGGYDLATLTDQAVAVTDDDLAGVGVTSDGGASVAVTEGSEAIPMTLVLTSGSLQDTVTIALTSDDTSAVTVTPTISFDATDWNTAKTVTVTGEEDVDTVGESVSISYAISGGGYDLATLTDQVVAVTDDDLAGVGVTSTGGASVAVTEGDTRLLMTLVLTSGSLQAR